MFSIYIHNIHYKKFSPTAPQARRQPSLQTVNKKQKIALKMQKNAPNFKNFLPAAPTGTAGTSFQVFTIVFNHIIKVEIFCARLRRADYFFIY